MTTTAIALVVYLLYAGWRIYMDVIRAMRQKRVDGDILRRIADVETLRPRVDRLEQIANSDPYGLPKPLEL
jgi:hypothetical protein